MNVMNIGCRLTASRFLELVFSAFALDPLDPPPGLLFPGHLDPCPRRALSFQRAA